MNFEIITQVAIAVFGVTAVFLSQSKNAETRRYASIFGLLGQPFWFYMAWNTKQWGILALCFLYTASWLQGFYNNWMVYKKTT